MAAFRNLLVAAVGALALGACATTNPAPRSEIGVWVRTDGQSGRTNPALAQQFEADRAACMFAGEPDRNCMAGRGYVLVPQSQAEAKAAELRAAAAARGTTPQ